MARGTGVEVRLQVLITSAIILSMLLLSAILVGKSYLDRRDALLQATIESAGHLAANIDGHVNRLIDPLESALRVLTQDPVTEAQTLRARLPRLPALAETLRASPVASAVYVGYADGSFLLLRALRNRDARRQLDAPDDAAFLLQSITVAPKNGARSGIWRYYDRELRELESRDRPDYQYNPHDRPWYQKALNSSATVLTDPYLFFTTGELGVTLARRNTTNGAVVGIDASVNDVSRQLDQLRRSLGNQLAIVDYANRVVAYSDLSRMLIDTDGGVRLASINELNEPELERLAGNDQPSGKLVHFNAAERSVYGVWMPLLAFSDASLRLLMTIPEDELLADAKAKSLLQIYWTLAVILLLVLLGVVAGRLISRPLNQLAGDIQSLVNFDFTRPVEVRSPISEVNALGKVMGGMSRTIHHFQRLSLALSREPDLDRMLNDVVRHLKDSLAADSAVLYLFEEEQDALRLVAASSLPEAPRSLKNQSSDAEHLKELVLRVFGVERRDDILLTALQGRGEQLLGILALDLPHDANVSMASVQRFVDELSGSAATAIETRQLMQRQRRLLDAMIRLLADAIDAKSPYTSGHCERVPELAQMLIDAAEASNSEPFRDFAMSEPERDEFRIAAWLHDCGKITSPEYVIDKATKLETIYNRIHEIRTRFEVLWRDADIRYLKGLLNGRPEADLRRERDRVQQQLQFDFDFVASANIGAEFLAEENSERLQRIASQTWQRHFDRRLGLSREEYDRLPLHVHMEELPVTERLLDDRPDHRIGWGERKPPVERDNPHNRWGFDMQLPEHSFNLGELYNLSVQRGTLTAEERFHINDHIVQTICMLSSLPLPPELKRVPDIAGNHHEKMDGQGYPRRLGADDLSIPQRVMAVADIFEALTASDRPYKKAKTLSESLRIMAQMARDRHIDVDLFELFLETRIYLRYAERFLLPEQIDEESVDRRQLLLLARRTEPDSSRTKGSDGATA